LLIGDIVEIKKQYRIKKLEEIVLTSEWFDIRKEPTAKGGMRTFYRIKPDLHFED
jgi:hypothetical protein